MTMVGRLTSTFVIDDDDDDEDKKIAKLFRDRDFRRRRQACDSKDDKLP
jgi:hypothetical protein